MQPTLNAFPSNVCLPSPPLGVSSQRPGCESSMATCSGPPTPTQPQFLSKCFLFRELDGSLQEPKMQVEGEGLLFLLNIRVRHAPMTALVIDD